MPFSTEEEVTMEGGKAPRSPLDKLKAQRDRYVLAIILTLSLTILAVCGGFTLALGEGSSVLQNAVAAPSVAVGLAGYYLTRYLIHRVKYIQRRIHQEERKRPPE